MELTDFLRNIGCKKREIYKISYNFYKKLIVVVFLLDDEIIFLKGTYFVVTVLYR